MKSRSKSKKLRILLIDDESKHLKHLQDKHPQFQFDHLDEVDDVLENLKRKISSKKRPDLILLDVYWPKPHLPAKAVFDAHRKTEQLLEKAVKPAIKKMNEAYLSAFHEWGTEILHQIHPLLETHRLPVVMYSSKGHFLLQNDSQNWLFKALEKKVGWLCKGTISPRAEKQVFRDLASKPKSIFIGHGGSPEWRKLARFVSQKLRLKHEEFNSSTPVTMSVKERLEEMLANSAIGSLVATGEDKQPKGLIRTRENVVHEIGLCQAAFGFNRAIVMLEEGVNEFSNIQGITHIKFKKGKLEGAFKEVRDILRREGFIPN